MIGVVVVVGRAQEPTPGFALRVPEVVQVQVIDDEVRVLLAERLPRWEYRYLKSILSRDPKIHMKDVIVTSVSTGGSGGEDSITENVTLNFAHFKHIYVPQKADGSGFPEMETVWDIRENAPGS